jgi:lipopolysaccharide transport system ATP-binding protein
MTSSEPRATGTAVAARNLGQRHAPRLESFGPPESHSVRRQRLWETIKVGWTSRAPVCEVPPEEGDWAIRELNFTIPCGAVVGLEVPRGGGRTTLLRMLTGLTSPTCGTIYRRGSAGGVFLLGEGLVNRSCNALENVRLAASWMNRKWSSVRGRVDEILTRSGLGDFQHRHVKFAMPTAATLLEFWCAVVMTPDLLLIDSCLNSYAGSTFDDFTAEIRRRRSLGLTTVLVPNEIDALWTECDYRLRWGDAAEEF